jgi:hypothetical protein
VPAEAVEAMRQAMMRVRERSCGLGVGAMFGIGAQGKRER